MTEWMVTTGGREPLRGKAVKTTGLIEGLVHLRFHTYRDPRGALVRVFDDAVMARSSVDFSPNYALASVNPTAGTLRGLHFQRGSAGEARLIACVSGATHNISIDLRPNSPTFLCVESNDLRGGDGNALLIPPGCANGWITLEPHTILTYQISGSYDPEASAGIRFNDPAFSLVWPLAPTVISEADRGWPDFDISQVSGLGT